MAITTTVVGSYPKPPEEGQPFLLRKTLHAVERGEASGEDVVRAQEELTRAIISEQEGAGIGVITDGQVRWDDLLSPWARNIAGFEIGGLLRFFDNNVYYRRPVCTGEIEWRGPSSVEAWSFADSVATRPVKAVIPGPVTFARLSVDEHYGDYEAFVLALALVLAQEAFELEAAGARHIQIDEPSLVDAPDDLELAARALDLVTGELEQVEVTLATYFGDAKRLGADLFSLPVTTFALYLVSGPANWELVDELPHGKKLQSGIVNARNTRLEGEPELSRDIDHLAKKVGAERLMVAPSCGLEFLPRENARRKLERLAAAAAERVGE
ncbi:methylcobamide--CoM methyltransferase [soil metagenome]